MLVENFAGTEKGGNPGDVSFQADYDPFIEKIAIVGDKKWEDVALLFTSKGIRRVADRILSTRGPGKSQSVAGRLKTFLETIIKPNTTNKILL